jgi:hypothetical protein
MAGKSTYVGIVVVILCLTASFFSAYYFTKASRLEDELQSKRTELEEVKVELETAEASLNLPVTKDDAIKKASGTFAYLNFSKQHFKDPELRVEIASLVWNQSREQYLWKVELMERKCGCGGEASLNTIVFFIDPVSNEILSTEEHVAESEQEYARQTCEAACHE